MSERDGEDGVKERGLVRKGERRQATRGKKRNNLDESEGGREKHEPAPAAAGSEGGLAAGRHSSDSSSSLSSRNSYEQPGESSEGMKRQPDSGSRGSSRAVGGPDPPLARRDPGGGSGSESEEGANSAQRRRKGHARAAAAKPRLAAEPEAATDSVTGAEAVRTEAEAELEPELEVEAQAERRRRRRRQPHWSAASGVQRRSATLNNGKESAHRAQPRNGRLPGATSLARKPTLRVSAAVATAAAAAAAAAAVTPASRRSAAATQAANSNSLAAASLNGSANVAANKIRSLSSVRFVASPSRKRESTRNLINSNESIAPNRSPKAKASSPSSPHITLIDRHQRKRDQLEKSAQLNGHKSHAPERKLIDHAKQQTCASNSSNPRRTQSCHSPASLNQQIRQSNGTSSTSSLAPEPRSPRPPQSTNSPILDETLVKVNLSANANVNVSFDTFISHKMADQAVIEKLEAGFAKLQAATPDKCHSLLKKYLTREVLDKNKTKKTAMGATLLDVCQSGFENLDSGVGIYAPDAESYTLFADLFNPIIEDYHGGFKSSDKHPQSDFGDLETLVNVDPNNEFVISTRVRCGRSLQGYPFNPCLTEAQYKEMESKVSSTLKEMEGDLAGTYYPLTGMTKETQQQLIDDHFLFKEGDRFLQAANACRYWPTGRGIYHNAAKTFLVWVNEEDHLRIISMQKGGDLKTVFGRLVRGAKAIEAKVPFSRDNRLGFLTFCPTNLGTTIRASVHIKLPKLAADRKKLEEVAGRYNLQVRGTSGEHTESVGGVYDISNKRRLGLTEYQAVREMQDGILELIKIEKSL